MKTERKSHWETIYKSKSPDEVSWTQEIPKASLDFINSFELEKSAKIIDIGGGDSKLVDYLLEEGYENVSVLDISAKALEKAKQRLGDKAKRVTWIVSDITDFNPQTTYDIWHDRASFHFLTTAKEIAGYTSLTKEAVNGFMIIGTFSKEGPKKCSGLEIKQYDAESMTSLFESDFKKIACRKEDHTTPFDTTQNFLFCSFKKR